MKCREKIWVDGIKCEAEMEKISVIQQPGVDIYPNGRAESRKLHLYQCPQCKTIKLI